MATVNVSSFAEIKTAVEDSTTTNILVTSDITFSGGIKINIAKSSLEIDFAGFTVTDNNSSSFTDTIYVPSTSNTLSVTVKNAKWSGRNYYGVVGVYNGNTGTTINLTSITYSGPQFVYNKNGITNIQDCTITISKNDSSTNPQEFCEANRLNILGTVKVTSYSSSDALIWFTGTGASLTVAENSNFEATGELTYFIYSDVSPVMLFKQNSSTVITTKTGLFYASGSSSHIASSFTLEDSASFVAYKQDSNSIPMFKCVSNFTLNNNSTFQLYSAVISSTALMYFGQQANIQINSPKSVVLYNRGGNIFSFQTGTASNPNTINITTEMLRLWNYAKSPLSDAGGFDDLPTTEYYKQNYENSLTVSVKATTSQLTNVESNLTSDDNGYPMTTSTLKLLTSNVISMGKLDLTADSLNDLSSAITGTTNALASIKTVFDGSELTTTADETGHYSIPLSNSLPVCTTVKILTNKQFLTKSLNIISSGSVSITDLPPLKFYVFSAPSNKKIIYRQNPDWSIQVTDTRTDGDMWYLYAYILQPLSNGNDNLENALIFKQGETTSTLTQTPLLVFSKGRQNEGEVTNINWNDEEGFLLEILTGEDYPKGDYQTQIQWQITTLPLPQG